MARKSKKVQEIKKKYAVNFLAVAVCIGVAHLLLTKFHGAVVEHLELALALADVAVKGYLS